MKRIIGLLVGLFYGTLVFGQTIANKNLPANTAPATTDVIATQEQPTARDGDGTVKTTIAQILALGGGGGGCVTANPTSLVGLTVKNGVLTTCMRSDAAPALDQSISPYWTGTHNFAGTVTGTALTNYFASPPPTGSTTPNLGYFSNFSYTGTFTGPGGSIPLADLGYINPGYTVCNSATAAASPVGCPTSAVRYATSTTLTLGTADNGGIISQNAGGSAVAVSIPQSGTAGYTAGSYQVLLINNGSGTMTITPTTSTINGGATATIAGGAAALIAADNTTSPGNYILLALNGSGGSGNGSFGNITIPCSGDTSGATDQTALQAAANSLTYSSTAPNSILLAGCHYYINSANGIQIPNSAGFNFHGTSREGTIIEQVTNNAPIFNFIGNNNNNNFDMGWMTLQWTNNQVFTNTNSIAFWFNGTAGYQAFNFAINHVQFVNGYRGISETSNCLVWGMTLSDGISQNTMVGSLVNLSAATSGQPTETIRNFYFNCYGGISQVANEPVVSMQNIDNVLLEQVEFNSGGYSNSVPQIEIDTGVHVTLLNVKSEFVYIAGGTYNTGSGAAALWRFLGADVMAIAVKSLSANITGGTSGTPVYAEFIAVGAITFGQLSIHGMSIQEQGNYATYLPYTQAYSTGTLKVMEVENLYASASGTNGFAPTDVAYVTAMPSLAPRLWADAKTPDTIQFNGDSNITLTAYSAQTVIYNVTLTANRTVTLPACTFQTQPFRIVRKAATPGAFTLTTTDSVSGFSEVIASNTNGYNEWRCVDIAGTYEWYPVGTGTL